VNQPEVRKFENPVTHLQASKAIYFENDFICFTNKLRFFTAL
jgi:hypothetical protein